MGSRGSLHQVVSNLTQNEHGFSGEVTLINPNGEVIKTETLQNVDALVAEFVERGTWCIAKDHDNGIVP